MADRLTEQAAGRGDQTGAASRDGNGSGGGAAHVRVAAVGDVHCKEASHGQLQSLFQQMAESADVAVLCGDLTDHGLVAEARVFAKELAPLARIPVVAVLGNHDYEAGHVDEVKRILTGAGVQLLDGDAIEVQGIGFAGVKGFAGGFGRGTLGSFGEHAIKAFVQECLDESMKLESALQRLRTQHRVAVLHYAPIKGTVEGEPPEIFPFLGSSRLEDPLNRYPVNVVVHGHAHRGAPEGKTAGGTPVYNVCVPLMRATYPNRPPFRLLDFASVPPPPPTAGAPQPAPTERPVETAVT